MEDSYRSVNNSQSLQRGSKTVGVRVVVDIDEKMYGLFSQIPRMSESKRREFLSDVVNAGLRELLYNDPKLIMDYLNEPYLPR